MKVTILQTDITWDKPFENQKHVEGLISTSERSDVYVLPEMWSTGFNTSPDYTQDGASAYSSSDTVAWMAKMAAHYNAAICGSLVVKTNEAFANRFYFVTPGGNCYTYDKRHLFTPGGEGKCYEKGKERVIVHFRGMRFLLQICYDLRFPIWSRNNEDYDAAIYVANWPSSRHNVWTTLLKARAIENQCYVIGVNRVGNDKQCLYKGGSMIVSPYGSEIVSCGCDEETVQAELDMEKLEKFRTTFPVLKDRDITVLDKENGMFA